MSRKSEPLSDDAKRGRRHRRREEPEAVRRANPLFRWLALVPVVAAACAYSGSLDGRFVFDDKPAIEENASLQTGVGGFWDAAFGGKHSPISNRPVTCLSLAFDYSTSRLDPEHYHVTNLLIHAANGALVFFVLRRVLRAASFAERFDDRRAAYVAAAAALLWSVHPLGCEAVAYVTQRSTLLMALFSLAALYCSLRAAAGAENALAWQIAGVVAVMLAVGAKEDAVVLPLLLLLFDRAYSCGAFAEALRKRRVLYAGAACAWLLLAAFVATGPDNTTVGYRTSPQVSAFEWLMTQAPVVAHYVRLAFWPDPLLPAYAAPFARSLSTVVWPGLFVLALVGLSIYSWVRRPAWGFLGAWFFLWLAPTSTVLPIVTEAVAERRMYLPLLAFVVPTVVAGEWTLAKLVARRQLHGRAAAAVYFVPVAVASGLAAWATWRHTGVYADEVVMWKYAADHVAADNRSYAAGAIFTGYGKALINTARGTAAGDPKRRAEYDDEAIVQSRRAAECEPPQHKALANLGGLLEEKAMRSETPADERQTLLAEAEKHYRTVLSEDPEHAAANNNLAKLLLNRYQTERNARPESPPSVETLSAAYEHASRSVNSDDGDTNAWGNLGSICFLLNRFDESDRAFGRAVFVNPPNDSAIQNFKLTLEARGRVNDAIAMLNQVLSIAPHNATARRLLAELAQNNAPR